MFFLETPQSATVPASDLISPARLDVPVKYILFRYFKLAIARETADKLYRAHIVARTGGMEPADNHGGLSVPKQGIDHYLKTAQLLFSNMRDHGYDTRFPVPLGKNGLLLNAAHRLACAAALGLSVPVQQWGEDGYSWDFGWFAQHGFTKNQLSLILKEYALLTADRTAIFILWGPALRYWEQLTNEIGRDYGIAGHLDFAFGLDEIEAYRSLIYDVYAHEIADQSGGMGHIDRKLGFLEEAPLFYRIVVASVPATDRDKVWGLTKAMKDLLRQAVATAVPVDKFITCHASGSRDETRHLAQTLLDPWNLAWAVRHRRAAKPRDEFLRWLSAYGGKLKALGIDPEDCCIVGSSTLEACGIRLSTDIDFTVRKSVRNALFDNNARAVDLKLDIVTEGYHRPSAGTPVTDDRLIADAELHFRFRGFKFASLPIVYDRKSNSDRPKDILDIEIIERWRRKHGVAIKDQLVGS